MSSLLQRLSQRLFGQATKPHEAPPASRAKPVPPPVATQEPTAQSNAVSALVAVGARRPLIAADGAIAGFEFCIDGEILRRLRLRTDHRGRAAYVSAALTSARLMAQSGRIGFARVPADWLVHALDATDAADAWVGIDHAPPAQQGTDLLEAAAALVPKLRAAGAKVGWSSTLDLGLTPDFVLLHQAAEPMAALLQSLEQRPEALRELPTLITDIEKTKDVELALAGGASFACGSLAPSAFNVSPTEALPIPPEAQRVGQLLNQLVIGTDTSAIVSDIKSDVGLSYRLLRRINSASFAQLNGDASIDQAVLMLGRNELYRWLSLLLVQFGSKRKVSSALQEITLWRSRLLELLALENKEAVPSQMFTLGLASMLGPLLKISLDDVVSTLNLPAPARQALLEQSGPWHAYLQMALLVEGQRLAEQPELAEPFGGVDRVMALADDAWAWAWAAEHASRD
jgi:EAL and modified HD-GYP domain-containing signal transduction protein